ncbi:MAG TPA: hypothetical protein VMV99_15605 [Rhodanobacter sp.]|nr:hypothetical protein [Rhodanobacter sp.]
MKSPACHPRRHGMIAAWLVLIALAGICPARAASSDAAWQAQPYKLGQGLYFPQQGLRIGGYANLHYYDVRDHRTTLAINDLSLFLTKDIGTRWKLFTEVEASNVLSVNGGRSTRRDSDIDVERLYVDYLAHQGITLRFGKFLTPVGQWNLIHADPLVWTVSRPLVTTAAFSQHATGAMMLGTVTLLHRDLDYWLFADDSKSLDPARNRDLAYDAFGADSSLQNNFQHAVGGRVLYHMLDDRLSVGASYLDYTIRQPNQHYRLVGLDFSWSGEYFNLSGEGIHRTSAGADVPAEYGGFLQTEIPLAQRLYLVGRYERYRSSIPPQSTTVRVVALNFHLQPGIVLKLERRDGTNNAGLSPSGWLAAVAVLF